MRVRSIEALVCVVGWLVLGVAPVRAALFLEPYRSSGNPGETVTLLMTPGGIQA